MPDEPTQERRARVNGVDLAYEERGTGRPLLFIHGGYGGPASSLWPGPRLVWHAATDGFRTINYDRRCAGRSEYVREPFTLHDIAQDARALLEQLDAPLQFLCSCPRLGRLRKRHLVGGCLFVRERSLDRARRGVDEA